jgi:hypothetical protein
MEALAQVVRQSTALPMQTRGRESLYPSRWALNFVRIAERCDFQATIASRREIAADAKGANAFMT